MRLASGTELAADVVVVATGLDMQMLGGATMSIDGVPLVLNQKVTYKAVLVEDVPNAAVVFGYTNASWTLKADLAAEYVCRLLNHMTRHGYTQFVVHAGDGRPRHGLGARQPASRVTCGAATTTCRGRAPAARGRCATTTTAIAACWVASPVDDGVLRFTA